MMFLLEEHGDTTHVRVTGEITEESDFNPILDAPGRSIVVDLGGVTRINSCGVREWLNFVGALKERARTLVLERCAPVIVTQLNTIYNFTGGGAVRSVLGPYYCPDCDAEENRLIDLAQGAQSLPDTIACPKCQGEMEFEEDPLTFLSFHGAS